MASPGLYAFDAYVDSRPGSIADKAALKARAELLYLDVYRELPSLLGVVGDADVAAKPTDAKLAARQTAFKGWYGEIQTEKDMLHRCVGAQLEDKAEVE